MALPVPCFSPAIPSFSKFRVVSQRVSFLQTSPASQPALLGDLGKSVPFSGHLFSKCQMEKRTAPRASNPARLWGCPAEFDPKGAQEQELGSSSPPSSHTLLDAVLQNLHDFGEAEDEEQKRIRKKRENKKRDVGTPEPPG